MRSSNFFLPILKENPSEAQIISHQLMLRAGMISQCSAGIYSWLPLGLMVLKNIEQIIREEHSAVGAQEILMPTIQPADLWRESGRYDAYGQEMLRIKDRHDRDMLYAPTAEEVVNDIFRRNTKSYRQLPANLYQFQWKFRDEIRPRFGVMRGREFLMKDAYSFDRTPEEARETYYNMMRAYIRTFRRMGLTAVPVRADTGPIGGDLSHEFHIVAKTGESALYYDARLEEIMKTPGDVNVEEIMNLYALADDMHDAAKCSLPADQLKEARGIEVGHVFYYGTKYSDSMNIEVMGEDGKPLRPFGGCYGIGVSRLVAAIIEASHDDKGIIWPVNVAPFKVGLVNIMADNPESTRVCDDLYAKLKHMGVCVLYDDQDDRPGSKFAQMDLIGLPLQLRVGPKGLANNELELKVRSSGETHMIPKDQALDEIMKRLAV